MKKYLIAIVSAGFILVPAVALGAINYSRVPASTGNIFNPVAIHLSVDAWGDFGTYFASKNSWRMDISHVKTKSPYTYSYVYGTCQASSTLTNGTENFTLPFETEYVVEAHGYANADCTGGSAYKVFEGGNNTLTLFTVVNDKNFNPTTAGVSIDSYSGTAWDWFIVFINHYWPFVLGAFLLTGVIGFGLVFLKHNFRS